VRPGAPSLTAVTAGVVAAVALAVAALATFVPAIHAARTSTVNALAGAARAPRQRGLVVAISRRLPVPLLLGLRLAARRPRRLVISAASIVITAAAIVGVLMIWQHEHASSVPGGLTNPVASGVSQVLLVITVVLVLLAAVNAIFVTWATVADARRPLAVARSLGATPEQVSAGISQVGCDRRAPRIQHLHVPACLSPRGPSPGASGQPGQVLAHPGPRLRTGEAARDPLMHRIQLRRSNLYHHAGHHAP
jgi:hypothetical protein